MSLVEVGRKSPAFSLKDQAGTTHKLSDYAGKPVVLYFYPKDRASTRSRSVLSSGAAASIISPVMNRRVGETGGTSRYGTSRPARSYRRRAASPFGAPAMVVHSSCASWFGPGPPGWISRS